MKRFIETDPHELTGNVFRLIGRDWMLVTAGKERSFNTMTASWGGLGVLWNAPVSMIFVRPSRYTYEFIEREREYSLSFLGPDDRRTLQVCGSKSGRDIDKAKETGLTPVFQEGTTYFEQAKLVLVCRKLYDSPMDPSNLLDEAVDEKWYPDKDYHRMFVGEIVKVLRKAE